MPDITVQDYDIEQENGNLVAKDANDNIVLTYNDAAGQWEFGTVSAQSLNTNKLGNAGDAVDVLDDLDLSDSKLLGNTDADGNYLLSFDVDLADDESTVLIPSKDTSSKAGFLFVRRGGASAVYFLQGGVGNVILDADPTNSFSDSQGNDGTTNIYFDGSNYVIENKDGQPRLYTSWLMS